MKFEPAERCIVGPAGKLLVPDTDLVTPRFLMLLEGECTLGAAQAAEKYGMTRQRYYQILKQFGVDGITGLESKKRGPKTNYVRTDEVERQVIRHRFLDPDASVAVIAQKLNQTGFAVSVRSVERIVEKYGLQKKTLSIPPDP